jgi:hypothetical protein
MKYWMGGIAGKQGTTPGSESGQWTWVMDGGWGERGVIMARNGQGDGKGPMMICDEEKYKK